jgi:hypothetical protein
MAHELPHANTDNALMDLTSRLNLETSFAIPAEEAADFLSTPDNPVSASDVTDFHEPSGPQTRANTIRRRSSSHTAIAPLVGRDDLLERFTHPYVLEAIEDAEEAREAAREEANPFAQSHRQTRQTEAEREVEQRREEIGALLERIDRGDTLDAAQLSLLLHRDISPKTETLTIRMTGREVTAETPELLGNLHDGIGSSALWAAEDAREMYEALPVRLLRRTASRIEQRPREAALGEHVKAVGVETVLEADPHFDRSEDGTGETAQPDGPPQSDPRRHTRPQFKTTVA